MEHLNTNLKNNLILNEESADEAYDLLLMLTLESLDIYAPMKTKKVRGNQARFFSKELSKAIMVRSRLKNKYQNVENRKNFVNQRNLSVKLKRKAIRNDFQKATADGVYSSKAFYDLVKPYLTNKGALVLLIEDNKIIEIVDIFNNYYVNIVKSSCGIEPSSVAEDMPRNTKPNYIIRNVIKKQKLSMKIYPIFYITSIQRNLQGRISYLQRF